MPQNDSHPAHGTSRRPLAGGDAEGPGLLWDNLTDFYCNFFDLIGVMAVMIDVGGAVRLFNRKAEELTGYVREDVLGQDWFSRMMPEPRRAVVRDRVMAGLRGGFGHMALPIPVVTGRGEELPVCWGISAVRDDEGRTFGLICLGYVPSGPDAPCVDLGRSMDELCLSVGKMMHDLINQSQVALGYTELALERCGNNEELRCMLDRACKALRKCGDLAISAHKLSNSRESGGHGKK